MPRLSASGEPPKSRCPTGGGGYIAQATTCSSCMTCQSGLIGDLPCTDGQATLRACQQTIAWHKRCAPATSHGGDRPRSNASAVGPKGVVYTLPDSEHGDGKHRSRIFTGSLRHQMFIPTPVGGLSPRIARPGEKQGSFSHQPLVNFRCCFLPRMRAHLFFGSRSHCSRPLQAAVVLEFFPTTKWWSLL